MEANGDKLAQQAVSGTLWVFVERISLEFFRFATTIVLARILGPKDFGLIALTSIFLAVSVAFIDSGFSKALIRKKESTLVDESTIFYFNLVICGIVVLLVNVFAPSIANYYKEPQLESVIRYLSFTLVLIAFRQIQQVVMSKSFNFKGQFKANVSGSLISGILGIVLALKGFGVWALVWQAIADNAIKTIMYWFMSTWRPLMVFSKRSFLELYKYGANLFFNDFLKAMTENMYGFVIGKTNSSYQLGLYDRGNKIASLIILNFQYSIQKVTFPLFSKIQDDIPMLKDTVKKSLDLIMYLVVPGMVILCVSADPLVQLLLSDKWMEAVPYLQLFCIYWMFFPFSGVNSHVVLLLGKSEIIFRQSLYIYGVQILALLLTYKYGIIWIIFGQIASTIVRQVILVYYAKLMIGFGYLEQSAIFLVHLTRSVISAIPAFFLLSIVQNKILLLIMQVSSSIFIYILLSYIFRSPSYLIILKQGQRLISKKR